MRKSVFMLATLLVAVTPAFAAHDEILRSDLPLWSGGEAEASPWDCSYENTIGKCMAFASGYWRRNQKDCGECTTWLSIEISSPIHGLLAVAQARAQQGLRDAISIPAVIVELGTGPSGAKLYAFQLGFREGSEYWLLSAKKEKDSLIKRILVLDPQCDTSVPGVKTREVDFASSVRTEYCSVSTKEALRRIAKVAAAREPLAVLEWVREAPED